MQSINLNEWLRYGFAGAISFLPWKNIFINDLPSPVIVIGIILLVGSLIYIFHRAIMYPIIIRIFTRIIYGKDMEKYSWIPWKVTKRELNQNIKRWQWSDGQNSKYNNLGEWAAQIHFLYCLVWALIIGIIIGWYCGIPISNQHIYLLGSVLSLIAAIIHHLRYIVFEKEITEHIENKAI